MNACCRALAALVTIALPSALPAAVPLRWTVETSRAQVAQFEAYRGETLDLQATMQSYGSPLATPAQPSLYWQTNGMGAAWWTAPATASGNVLRATWSPTNDCGGTVYNCFIGGPDATYRAAFRLRMLPSPGFTPNHIPLPTVKAESDPVFSAWLATNEFSSAGVDTNAVLGLITSATNGLATKSDLGGYLPLTGGTLTGDLAVGAKKAGAKVITIASDFESEGITLRGGSDGIGSHVEIGGSLYGGELKVMKGSIGSGLITVEGDNAMVMIGGKKAATEEVVSSAVNSKADKSALEAHVADTGNPHAVTASQIGAVPFVGDGAATIGRRIQDISIGVFSFANGYNLIASGTGSHAEGADATALADYSHASGVFSETRTGDDYAFAWNGDELSVTEDKPYLSHGPGTFNVNPVGGTDGFYIGEQTLSQVISNEVSAKADKTDVYTKAEVDAKGYVTEAVTNGLATAESVDGLAADVAGKADAAAVYAKDEADARFYPADEGALWASWWSGDGFRVAVSNYDVAASSAAWDRLPSASFDYRPGGTGALVRVWSETTRWERHRAEAAAFSNAVDMALAGKAGLDWGRTTPTGFDAPEGFTWLDTPAVAVAGGLAWQRTVTSEGAVWLLCANGMVAESGGATNGSFRVVDMSTGEAAFEVVQGERRTVGANCGEVYTWTAEDGKTHMRVVYNVASDDPPVLHVAEALKPNGGTVWHDEGAEGCPAQFAGWTGSSGAWTNALWRASAPAAGANDALFCFATYKTGGETVVKNHAPVSMSKIVVGGVTYAIGTATVGGHTVLTLTEAK